MTDHSKLFGGQSENRAKPEGAPFFDAVDRNADPHETSQLEELELRLSTLEAAAGLVWCEECRGYHPDPDASRLKTVSAGTGGDAGAVGSGAPF